MQSSVVVCVADSESQNDTGLAGRCVYRAGTHDRTTAMCFDVTMRAATNAVHADNSDAHDDRMVLNNTKNID